MADTMHTYYRAIAQMVSNLGVECDLQADGHSVCLWTEEA